MTPSSPEYPLPSLLQTDAYKFSMAEAGFPLRRETFYYSHRKGGWQYLPVDVEKFIRDRLPQALRREDDDYLAGKGYSLGGASIAALHKLSGLTISTLPKGSWFQEREPVFSVTGPSALVSWLEPLVLQLNYRIQLATHMLKNPDWVGPLYVTCTEEADIVQETAHDLNVRPPKVVVDTPLYEADVFNKALQLVEAVEDPSCLFEVGMRGVSCMAQHEIALKQIQAAGITRTSNVELARKLDMIPVGTMGHEHIQRHGSDYAAFTAMRDRHVGFVFYLLDTFNTILSGIPAALKVMAEDPSRASGIRFDSEQRLRGQYLYAIKTARAAGLEPTLGLESGWNLQKTQEYEVLRIAHGWPADKQSYGIGGFLVTPKNALFTRDRVSAVWKICQTGGRATMKFGDEPQGGKESLPGLPQVWRSATGGYVIQKHESWRPAEPVSSLTDPAIPFTGSRHEPCQLTLSPGTHELIQQCADAREQNIALLGS